METPLERREFGKVLLGSALSASGVQAQQKPHGARPWPPDIKTSVQMPTDPSDEDLQFVNQVGACHVNIPTQEETATAENFVRLKNKVESWRCGRSCAPSAR